MGKRTRQKIRDGVIAAPERPVSAPAASARYTPRQKKPFRFRPDWHRPVGWAIVVFAITVAVVNDLALFDIRVMPGGHNELYLVLAVLIAGGGTWFLGLFDRSM